MINDRLRLLLLTMALSAAASAYGQAGDPGIRVEGAWARSTPMMSGGPKAGSANGAVYAVLVNPGKQPDALVAAASDVAAAVEIHESYQDMGMMMMRPVRRIGIPAGKKVELKPGGYHIMLLGLKRQLKAGQSMTLTLQFDRAGKIPVNAVIK